MTTAFQDGFPLLLVSDESLLDLQAKITAHATLEGKKVGGWNVERWGKEGGAREVVMERFRPNVITSGGTAFDEETWGDVTFGDEREKMTVVSRCGRCTLPNVDPATGDRDAAIPAKILAQYRIVVSIPYHSHI